MELDLPTMVIISLAVHVEQPTRKPDIADKEKNGRDFFF